MARKMTPEQKTRKASMDVLVLIDELLEVAGRLAKARERLRVAAKVMVDHRGPMLADTPEAP
jgi:hypothetical protein